MSHWNQSFLKARGIEALQQEICYGLSQWATKTTDLQRCIAVIHWNNILLNACHNESQLQEICFGLLQLDTVVTCLCMLTAWVTATKHYQMLVAVSHCNESFVTACHSEPLPQEIFKGSSQWLTATRDLFWLVIISHCHKRFSKARHSHSLQREIFNGFSQWAAAT